MQKSLSLIIIIMAGICFRLNGEVKSAPYFPHDFVIPQEWLSKDLEELLKMSYVFQHSEKTDSAILGFSIICSRYKEKMSDKEKEMTMIALNNRGLLFFNSYDFQRSYSDFVSALNIAKKLPDTPHLGNIYNNLASLKYMAGELNHSERMISDANKNWIESFQHSVESNDELLPMVVYTNLTSNWFEDPVPSIFSLTDSFIQINDYKESTFKNYCKERISAIKAVKNKDWDEALKHFQNQLEYIDPQFEGPRFEAQAYIDIANAYLKKQEYGQALYSFYKCDSIANANNQKEIEARNHLRISQTLDKLARHEDARIHLNKYYEKNDSLLTSYHLAHLNDIDFYTRVAEFEEDLREKETRHQMLLIIIAVIGCALIVLSIVIYSLLITRKRLSDSRLAIIRRTREWIGESRASLTSDTGCEKQEEYERIAQEDQKKDCSSPSKYVTSPLDDERRKEMVAKISEIIETSDEIFSTEFSLSRLSEICGYKRNYVSQVINQHYGRNFNQLIATQRIKKACVILSDTEKSGLMTIDYIANEVGFRSRSSLLMAFKREIGMTPSEFQKMVNSKID